MNIPDLMKRGLLLAAFLVCCSLFACGGSGGSAAPTQPRPVLDATYRANGHALAGDVFVHLFEWPWSAVATECETQLGPKGFKAVQISPPQEDILGSQWWTRYQPVSYSINQSRSGTRAQFIDMVNRCNAVGVGIYVDAVINHMTAGAGTGSDGTAYSKYNYPGLYAQGDFHTPCAVNNYQDAANVQDCELVGLADLNTGSAFVQQKIADYLVGLANLGVAGFRLDAAKHIQAVELNAILDKVNQTLSAQGKPLPYFFSEVIDYGGEAVRAHDYYGLGYGSGGAADITEFKFRGVADKFMGNGGQFLAQLNPNGSTGNQFSEAAWGIMPADKAVVFLENHDTQRSGGISYRMPATYRLASIWMLAQPYGYPSIMSSYSFDLTTQAGRDAGPPGTAPGCVSNLEAATTTGLWVCEHRDPAIANMIAFRHAVAGTAQANWWDDGANAIAFSRGNMGFVAINGKASAVARTFTTGLAPGKYCNVLMGGVDVANTVICVAGTPITVDSSGNATFNLPAQTGLVLQAGVSVP
jgi:alpha-amylase